MSTVYSNSKLSKAQFKTFKNLIHFILNSAQSSDRQKKIKNTMHWKGKERGRVKAEGKGKGRRGRGKGASHLTTDLQTVIDHKQRTVDSDDWAATNGGRWAATNSGQAANSEERRTRAAKSDDKWPTSSPESIREGDEIGFLGLNYHEVEREVRLEVVCLIFN